MIMEFWHNWFFWALLTPAIWAIVTILDVCLVGSGIYDRAIDGAVISAGFSIFPLLLILPLLEVAQFNVAATVSASIAGGCFFFHTLFFFKALFALNDATSAEAVNTLSVVVVPLLAFQLLGEKLTQQHYFAIFSAAIGTCILAVGHLKTARGKALVYAILSMLFVSLSSVAQAHALTQTTYGAAIAIFSGTVFLYALVPVFSDKRYRFRIGHLCRKSGAIFITSECLQQGAVLSSQRATKVGPSVSLVMVAECALPIFILFISAFTALLLRCVSRITVSNEIRLALSQQFYGLPVKLTSLCFIASSIWLVYVAPT